MLDENEVDIILMGQPPEEMDVIAESFMDNPLVVIAPAGHHLAGQRQISLQAISNEVFLMREKGSGTRNSVERFLAQHGVILPTSMEMNTNGAIKQGVEVGLGLGVVSLHTIDRELADGRLAILDVEHFPLMRKWYIVHRTGKHLSNVGLAFKAYVRKEAQRFVGPNQSTG